MSTSSSLYGAFNARWIAPSDVAKTFVQITEFEKLAHTRHSIVMGPRGCGKTTLFKMLTREAQESWRHHRAEDGTLSQPDFEAVYIPSDIKWSFELRSIEDEPDLKSSVIERSQRAFISIGVLVDLLKTFRRMLPKGSTGMALDQQLSIALLDRWKLGELVPTLSHITLELQDRAVRIRNRIIGREEEPLVVELEELPPAFTAHALDSLMQACGTYEAVMPAEYQPRRWGVCFDELEIAPHWLQTELLRAVRSVEQQYLLKLTWTPILPEVLREHAQAQADFDVIRIWHSHVLDARAFCREFASRLLTDRLGREDLTPEVVFGRSVFAAEEKLGTDHSDAYGPGSEIWTTMVELAKRDRAFRIFLEEKGFDPANPISENQSRKDKILRKIKPIVLLRETFRGAERARSRKRVALYSGEDAIYAMSDGNPRWLSGLLNELLDAVKAVDMRKIEAPLLRYSTQAKILSAASRRMNPYVRAFPIGVRKEESELDLHLAELIRLVGDFFKDQILGDEFTDDPVGSFVVDSSVRASLLEEINRGLLLGALIYVGDSALSVPDNVEGSRIRLSFMFSPMARIAFRNFRPVNLSTILQDAGDPRQLELWEVDDEID